MEGGFTDQVFRFYVHSPQLCRNPERLVPHLGMPSAMEGQDLTRPSPDAQAVGMCPLDLGCCTTVRPMFPQEVQEDGVLMGVDKTDQFAKKPI